jgi:hypothetical protein
VPVVIDDTVDGHKGKKVYGKGCHRDAVRSTHSYTAYRWGHKWVALGILVKFPWAARPWALPVLIALYRSKEWNRKHRRRHKTPPELARQLLAVLMRWFPERKFVSAGDGGFSTHDLAAFAHRHRERVTLIGRFYPAANWFCPSCHQKKVQLFGALLTETILFPVPHRHFTLGIPKMLRPYFRFDRDLLKDLCHLAHECLLEYLRTTLDLPDGQVIRGVRIRNPFTQPA